MFTAVDSANLSGASTLLVLKAVVSVSESMSALRAVLLCGALADAKETRPF